MVLDYMYGLVLLLNSGVCWRVRVVVAEGGSIQLHRLGLYTMEQIFLSTATLDCGPYHHKK